MSETSSRNLSDIDDVLQLAKLTQTELKPISQAVYFTNFRENLCESPYKLLQLNQNLMNEFKEGEVLHFKGDDNENVVLCSKSKTYEIVQAETSNSLLLIQNMKFCADIEPSPNRNLHKIEINGIFHEYLEATLSKPHLRKLEQILEQSAYKGPEHEYSIDSSKIYTYENISQIVQASDEELQKALDSMDVITIDNKIRQLDFEYHFRVLSYMLKLIEENCWQLDEIDFEETLTALKELVPDDILNGLFDKYTEESKIIDGLQLYKYKESDICKFFAKVLLYSAGKFNLDEFLQAWSESVPEGMTTNEEMLYGIAVINRKSNPNVIRAFPEENLPESITERFHALFEVKEKWTVSEIAPYIKRLATEKMDVNALLMKYARVSNVDGVKYYSAKHAK